MKIVGDVLWRIEERDLINGEVCVPCDVKSIDEDALRDLKDCEDFKSLTFEEGSRLEIVNEGTFTNSTYLRRVNFSNCKNLREIRDCAFKGCGELESADFSACEELTRIGDEAFGQCNHLKEVSFTRCHKLERFEDNAFYGCTRLKDFRVDYCDALVKFGANCFYNCRSLENVSGFDKLESLEYVGVRCFANCGLKEIRFPKVKSGVALMIDDYAFSGCENMSRVDGEGCVINGIGEDVFEYCRNLKEVTFKDASVAFIYGPFSEECEVELVDLRGVTGVKSIDMASAKVKNTLISSSAKWGATERYNQAFVKGTQISLCNNKGEVVRKFVIGDGNIYDDVKVGANHLIRLLEAKGVNIDFRVLNNLRSKEEASIFLDNKNVKQYENMMSACFGGVQNGREDFVEFLRKLGYFGFEDCVTGNVDHQKVGEYKKLLARNLVQSKIKNNIRAKINKNYIDKIVNEKSMEVARTHSLSDLVYSFVMNNIASNRHKSELFDALKCVDWVDQKDIDFAQFMVLNFHDVMDKAVIGKDWAKYRINENKNDSAYDVFYAKGTIRFDVLFKKFHRVLTQLNKKVITRSDKNRLTVDDFMDGAQYKDVTEENRELATYCARLNIRQMEFQYLSEKLKEGRAVKDEQVLRVCEDEVASGKNLTDKSSADLITYKVLEKGDPLGLVLGNITNCCQKYGGVGQDCMVLGATDVNSTFMTINKGDKILAQGWIWYDPNTYTIAIDNIEVPEVMWDIVNKEKKEEVQECVQRFCDNAFRTMNENGYEVKNVIIGASHTDIKSLRESYKRETKREKMIDCPYRIIGDYYKQRKAYTDIMVDGQYEVYRDGKRSDLDNNIQNDVTSDFGRDY